MQMLLYKAADLGMRLSAAFQSQTGIPFSDVNLQTQNVHQPPWTQFSSLSEVSTLSMEFTYLERAAGLSGCQQGSLDSPPGANILPVTGKPAVGHLCPRSVNVNQSMYPAPLHSTKILVAAGNFQNGRQAWPW